jgi:hypothetical protein
LTNFLTSQNNINNDDSINILLILDNISLSKLNDFASIGKSSVRHLNDIKKEKIVAAIQEDKNLWIKILTFNKIELKDVKDVLNKKGVICENEILKDYLTELGALINQPR